MSAVLDHPYDSRVESALNSFRSTYVDLGEQLTKTGRGIRDILISEIEAESGVDGFFYLLKGFGFAAGSFGRRTQCKPLDDIDLYIVIDAEGHYMNTEIGSLLLEGNSVFGPIANDYSLRTVEGHISSDLMLKKFAGRLADLSTVKKHGATTGLNAKGKSAFISFDAAGLNVDVSPVVWAKRPYDLDRYYMPQGSGAYTWKATNPKEDQRRISSLNQSKNGLILPTVRMMKWWNEAHNARRLKGIHLEVMIEQALEFEPVDTLGQSLYQSLLGLSWRIEQGCPDPTGLGPALDVNLSFEDRTASKTAIDQAYSSAYGAALKIQAGDSEGAVAAWSKVFNGMT